MATDPNKHSTKRQKEKRRQKFKDMLRKNWIPAVLGVGSILGGAQFNHHYIQADDRAIEAIHEGDEDRVDLYAGRILFEHDMQRVYAEALESGSISMVREIYGANSGWRTEFQDLYGQEDLARDIFREQGTALAMGMVDHQDFETLAEFIHFNRDETYGRYELSYQEFVPIIIDRYGVDVALEYTRHAIDKGLLREASSVTLITSVLEIEAMAMNDYVSDIFNHDNISENDFTNYVIGFLMLDGIDNEDIMQVYDFVSAQNLTELQARIVSNYADNEVIQSHILTDAARSGNLDLMIAISQNIRITDDMGILEIAGQAFLNGHVVVSKSFADHYDIEDEQYVNVMFSIAIQDQNSAVTISFMNLLHESFGAESSQYLESVARYMIENAESDAQILYNFDVFQHVGHIFSDDMKEEILSAFSGNLDDQLRATWAENNNDRAQDQEQEPAPAPAPVVTAPALPAPN